MPRPNLLPTPAASTEIQGKGESSISATEKSFNLPSPAIASNPSYDNPPIEKQALASPAYTLPPPPTRSRTIIQVKPKPFQSEHAPRSVSQPGPKYTNKKPASGNNAAVKKQPSSTSVAGKKIARKTAHSVIERRRRSKMNEEFATLKSMIPACTDQDMHKLAILQASIDYLRYLEKCVDELKTANNSLSTPLVQPQAPPRRADDEYHDDDDDEEEQDTAMGNSEAMPPDHPRAQTQAFEYTSPQSITPSPALDAQSHYQTSSYASSVSTLPSPAFGPQSHHQHSRSHFSFSLSTSPTILPDTGQDEEATAALLMLNKDRRNPKGARSMSVKDLLSS